MADPTFLVRAIAELKSGIQRAVQEEVNKFKSVTGLTPSEISIEMLDATTMGDPVNQHMVGRAEVRLGRL